MEKERLPFLKAETKSFDAPFIVNAFVYAVSWELDGAAKSLNVHNKVWTLEARFINNCCVANKNVTTFEQFQFELWGVLYCERTSKKEFTTI